MPTSEADCPFCRIARGGDTDDLIVHANGDVVVFPPPEPAALGHTLLIPREHVPDIGDLSVPTAQALARATLQVAAAVRAAVQPEGLSIIQSNGAAATQTVDHVHVHVVPRWSNDDIGPSWPTRTDFSVEERYAVAADIRSHIELVRGEPATDANTSNPSPDDRRKHLEFIQAVVTRMSASSATAKGWLLPVVTAAYGYAIAKHNVGVGLLGIVATLVFGLMDANYLRQEKAYRELYDVVARGVRPVPLFSLDPSHANDPIPDDAPFKERMLKFLGRWIPGPRIWSSWSIAPFYLVFMLTGAVVVLAA